LNELKPIHALHLQVADHHVHRVRALQHSQSFGAVTRLQDLTAAQLFEQVDGHGTLEKVVFEYQHPERCEGHDGSRAC